MGPSEYILYVTQCGEARVSNSQCLKRIFSKIEGLSLSFGAIGLTSTAPATYYVGMGKLETQATVLWFADWTFACNQIHLVQLRIHGARIGRFAEKLARGPYFVIAQATRIILLVSAVLAHLLRPFSLLAIAPAVGPGSLWFFQRIQPLDVKKLSWFDMMLGIAFGVLLVCPLLYS